MNSKSIVTVIAFFISSTFALLAQDWEQMAALPAGELGRHHPVTFTIDGFGYMVTGGTDQGAASDFYRYDPSNDSWSILEAFPGPARGFAYGVSHEGKGYMGFGLGAFDILDDLWEYDPVTDEWTELASCPCEARYHPAFQANNGKIFMGLGSDGANKKDWWEYDIATNAWSKKPDFPGAARHHPYHFSIDEFVYVAFGHGNIFIFNDLFRYDPLAETWMRMASLPAEGRVAGTQFDYNGKGYALSGQGADHNYFDTGEFWEYDPATDSWTSLTDHPGRGRWAPGSFIIDDFVYMVAGENSNGQNLKDLMRFDLRPLSGNSTIGNAEAISAYPNPTKQLVTLDIVEPIDEIRVFNQLGELIKVERPNTQVLDLSSYPAGNYTVQIKAGEKHYASQVVKF